MIPASPKQTILLLSVQSLLPCLPFWAVTVRNLASFLSILHLFLLISAYVYRYWCNEWSVHLHPTGFSDLRCSGGNSGRNRHPLRRYRRRSGWQNLRLLRPSIHHDCRRRLLLRRSHSNGVRPKLRLPHVRPILRRRRHRIWLLDCPCFHR